MPIEERIRKWTALMKVVRDTDVSTWRDDFVSCLTSIPISGDGDAPFHQDPFHHEGHAANAA